MFRGCFIFLLLGKWLGPQAMEIPGLGPPPRVGSVGSGRGGFLLSVFGITVDVPYWRLHVSYGSSGLVRDLRSKATLGREHTLGARRVDFNVQVLN